MEFSERRQKRSLTDLSQLGNAKSQVLSLKLAKLRSMKFIPEVDRMPVYSPGPKPSKLLLDFVNQKQQVELTRLAEIKSTLHVYSLSQPCLRNKLPNIHRTYK